jgi:hypothetical protein
MTVEVKACSILSKRTINTAIVPVSTTIERGTKTKSHSAQTEDSTLLDSLKAMERKRVNNFADSLFKSYTNLTCQESKTLRLLLTKTKLNSKAVLILNLSSKIKVDTFKEFNPMSQQSSSTTPPTFLSAL